MRVHRLQAVDEAAAVVARLQVCCSCALRSDGTVTCYRRGNSCECSSVFASYALAFACLPKLCAAACVLLLPVTVKSSATFLRFD